MDTEKLVIAVSSAFAGIALTVMVICLCDSWAIGSRVQALEAGQAQIVSFLNQQIVAAQKQMTPTPTGKE